MHDVVRLSWCASARRQQKRGWMARVGLETGVEERASDCDDRPTGLASTACRRLAVRRCWHRAGIGRLFPGEACFPG